MTPEGRIKASLNRRLKPMEDQQKIHKLMPVQTGFGKPGLDYHICAGGWYVCIETKADASKKLTPRQLQTKAEVEGAGGYVFIVFDKESEDKAVAFIETLVHVTPLRRQWLQSNTLKSGLPARSNGS